jgi:predicted RNA-binding Zn-ribbon protein involved in translation (DUF1610 family)
MARTTAVHRLGA